MTGSGVVEHEVVRHLIDEGLPGGEFRTDVCRLEGFADAAGAEERLDEG